MRYVERGAPDSLDALVECVWFLEGSAPGEGTSYPVLPDGCMDLLFDLEGSAVGRPRAYAVGTMTRPLDVQHRGRVSLVGVRFRAGAALPFLGIPCHELTDGTVPFDALPRAVRPVPGAFLLEGLAEAPDHDARTALLHAHLQLLVRRAREARGPRLPGQAVRAPDPLVLRAAALLDGRAAPPVPVGVVAERLGCTRRHLERRFGVEVGLTPGTLGRIGRLRRALRLLAGPGPLRPLPDVAVGAGYHDQPHMTRELRALANTTPGRYRALHGPKLRGAGPGDRAGTRGGRQEPG